MTRTAIASPSVTPSAIVLSPVMRDVYRMVEKLARTNISVLIAGETGTGKELVAGALHSQSTRGSKELVALNCAALNANLVESELFGHSVGAFTGASHARPGLVEAAAGSTLFLDEVGELPLQLQTRLLRVVERRRVKRVGANEERAVDVRFIAATNQDLVAARAKGRFRSDLYFRLAAATVWVPPLRERSEEVIPLAEHFLMVERPQQPPRLTTPARGVLLGYAWPGNVRELRHMMQYLAVTCRDEIGEVDVRARLRPAPLVERAVVRGGPAVPTFRPLYEEVNELVSELERDRVRQALEVSGGNQVDAARLLSISHHSLWRKHKKYKLGAKEGRSV